MKSTFSSVLLATISSHFVNAQYTATYDPNNLPPTTENGQTGTNQCGTENSQTSNCQNAYVNSISDFCYWGPPEPRSAIGNVEEEVVAYCIQPGRGTRLIPKGTFKGVHFIETPDYVQVLAIGDFTSINIAAGDTGGELDPHGATGNGNPVGGLVFSNVFSGGTGLGQQLHEWTNFMAVDEACIRVCKEGPNGPAMCQHIYDTMGCEWNMPGDYTEGFTSCKGDSGIPMGLYPQPDGSTSTFFQGQPATPSAHPAPSTSDCTTYQSADIFAALATILPPSGAAQSTPTPTGSSTSTSRNLVPSRTPATSRTTSTTSTATSTGGAASTRPSGLIAASLAIVVGAITILA